MNTISINYTLVWELKTATEYKFTKSGICFNTKTGKQIKQAYNSGSIGFNIRGKFISINRIKTMMQKIKEQDCPF